MTTIARYTLSPGLVAAALLVSGCQLGNQPPQTLSLQAPAPRDEVEERKDEMMRQLAHCESGGYGPSRRPVYRGPGAPLWRTAVSGQTASNHQPKAGRPHAN